MFCCVLGLVIGLAVGAALGYYVPSHVWIPAKPGPGPTQGPYSRMPNARSRPNAARLDLRAKESSLRSKTMPKPNYVQAG